MMKMSRRQLLFTHLFLLVFVVWSVTPIFWTLVASFKPDDKIFSTSIKIIDEPTLENYTALLTRGDFVTWAINSLFVSIVTTIVAVFLSATCAYAISRFRYRGRSTAIYLFLVAQMFPGVILLIPLYSIFTNLKLI